MPNQTGANPWQLQCPMTYTQCVLAVIGPQDTVQLITQRAREALNDQQRVDASCSINKENFLLPLINMKRLRGKILSVCWQKKKNEVHN